MSCRRQALVAAATLLIGAVMASSASAAVETVPAKWFKNGAELAAPAAVEGEALIAHTLETEIGGLEVELNSTEFTCQGCNIENKEITAKAGKVAFGSGKVKFENATVVKPANCIVKDEAGNAGQVVTKPLFIHGDFMDTIKENKTAFIQFVPQAGAVFAQFELAGAGCAAIAGKKNLAGSLFGESASNTGEEQAEHELSFSPAVQATSGAALFVGIKPAEFTGDSAWRLVAGGNFTIK